MPIDPVLPARGLRQAPLLKRLSAVLQLGIAARLGIAFAAVGGFAIAVNLIAVRGTLLVKMHETQAVAMPPQKLERVPSDAPASPPALPPVAPSVAPSAIANVNGPLATFHRTIQRRLESIGEAQASEVDLAATELRKVTARLNGSALQRALLAHQTDAAALLELADRRRTALQDSRRELDRLASEMRGALDGGWKILGRVVIRQSVTEMSRAVDQLAGDFETGISAEQSSDRVAQLQALAIQEDALMALLERQGRAMARALDGSWVNKMTDAVTSFALARRALTTIETRIGQQRSAFLDGGATLLARAARDARSRPPATVPPEPARAASGPANAAMPAAMRKDAKSRLDVVPAASATLPPPGIRITSERLEDQDQRKTLVLWTSVMLFVLLLISVGTVVSIVRPVRALVSGTRRVSEGAFRVRVPRGGMREIDALAASFNGMAERLEIAQADAEDYRSQLESRVEQRTRQLRHLADHDPLTDLPNRRSLLAHLEGALVAARSTGRIVGVYFLDLDNFKNLNDSLGHAYGDRVLRSIAARLQEESAERGYAARLGGDEFTVVVSAAADVEEIRAAGWQLVRAFQRPLPVDGRDVLVSVSVGASHFPGYGDDAEALLREADAALFRAKQLGRSQLSLFTPDLLEIAATKFTTEQGLRRAVERKEFELVFQPEIDASTLEVPLVEALLRWRLPDGSLASPGAFLGVAEESGLIMEISDWVLQSAIETAARWQVGDSPGPRIAINVSARQLVDADFAARVERLLQQHGVTADHIEIELTENVLQTGAATIETLHQLRRLGIGIALDDFGSGYSSLASLEQLPLTRVKLDRSLIDGIDRSDRSAAIARSIVTLCRDLGLHVTAEGIERESQLAMLLGMPGVYLQGFLLARPLPADRLGPFLQEFPARVDALLLAAGSTLGSKPRPTAGYRQAAAVAAGA